jgi:hypothetical protein
MPGSDTRYAPPPWAMPLAEKPAAALRGIAPHRDRTETGLACPNAGRASRVALSLAHGGTCLSYGEGEKPAATVTAAAPVSVRQALKRSRAAGRRPAARRAKGHG